MNFRNSNRIPSRQTTSEGNALVDIAGNLLHETERAFRFYDGARAIWLPKSQCQWDPEERIMTLPMWLAREKELI